MWKNLSKQMGKHALVLSPTGHLSIERRSFNLMTSPLETNYPGKNVALKTRCEHVPLPLLWKALLWKSWTMQKCQGKVA